eukprot:TRINITY_DN16950_c0_g1_i1.p1 TRINITY_DN16950_c0_g1~~TRINITY_DN16950_c0_g1_i1.p1  ORF type:complete len:100 (+),score=48.01 TRINITY_DN16950_c0_g1_i1:137-436(+)
MIRRPPRSTQSRSSAASDVYKRQQSRSVEGRSASELADEIADLRCTWKSRASASPAPHGVSSNRSPTECAGKQTVVVPRDRAQWRYLSLIHISEPTRPY